MVPEFVLLEAANALSRVGVRGRFIALVNDMLPDPGVRLVPVSRRLFRLGLDLYVARKDKDWSLTDCISFVIMRRAGIADALTTDGHFAQAGFRALLRRL